MKLIRWIIILVGFTIGCFGGLILLGRFVRTGLYSCRSFMESQTDTILQIPESSERISDMVRDGAALVYVCETAFGQIIITPLLNSIIIILILVTPAALLTLTARKITYALIK